ERLGVGHRDDLVGDRAVVGLRPEVLTDALDEVGPPAAAGVRRALGVRAPELAPAAGDLLEVATGARDRAAGAHTRDEVGDPAVGLAPQLRAGGQVVARPGLPGGVLVRLPRVLHLGDGPRGH